MQTLAATAGIVKESDPYSAVFEPFEKDVSPNTPPWLRALRSAGIAHFSELGFPTPEDEEWRFTNMAPLATFPFRPVTRALQNGVAAREIEPFTFGGLAADRLVFINGHYAPELSSRVAHSPGVKVSPLVAAIHTDGPALERHLGRHARLDDHPFAALNTAFIQDGAFIEVPAGVQVAPPIHLLFVTSEPGVTTQPRILITAGANAAVRVIEDYVSLIDSAHWTNAVTEIVTGENAAVEHCKVQRENTQAFHVAMIQADQARGSRVLSHSISLGARLARNDIRLRLGGEGIDSVLNGLYFATGDQLVDHHTVADHASPRCGSHEFYHGILGGRARGVFNGKIFVRKDAQKTDAKQTNRNLLLSDTAVIDTKPQLEIFADDVKCTHGATVGQLDEEAVFYLRARGIGAARARRMLVHAFASEILNRVSIEPVREELDRLVFDLLEQHIEGT
ncbi:MAG TPA: Fe-S cluster assembly protein SufD [Methylomirabilota bacterium]|nr:Fe-S cluster assembly protein SufD [Methylomirabilota bacterium]